MEFKSDKTYRFDETLLYGFLRKGGHILTDCHLYFGENSFEAVIAVSVPEFESIITRTDDKSGAFENACRRWLRSEKEELFLPDLFPRPVHGKINHISFRYEKTETVEDELGADRVFHFRSESLFL